jgi:glycogen(starch) synthase
MLPQVLMLGWEYPPYVNGGLGVASQGLAEAMSQFVRLQMVVPQAQGIPPGSPEFLGFDRFGDTRFWQETAGGILSESDSAYGYSDFKQPLYKGNLAAKVARYRKLALRVSEDQNFDLIHAHDWMTFPAALTLRQKREKPLVLHVHSTEYDRSGPGTRNWIYRLEKEAFQEADMVVPVSQYTAEVLKKEYAVPERKITTVHNAVHAQKGIRLPRPFPELLVVFIGRMSGQKGPDLFLKMALKVLEHFDRVRFILAGMGEQRPILMRLAAQARIGDRFHCVGYLDTTEKQKMLGMANLLVMPSLSEPFGLVALEAAQMGVPCIISQNSGVKEVLPAAIAVDPMDISQMAHYVVSMLRYHTLRKTVALHQKENLKKVGWENAAMKLLTAYREKL